jgi:hypothetical protein
MIFLDVARGGEKTPKLFIKLLWKVAFFVIQIEMFGFNFYSLPIIIDIKLL